MEIHVFLKYTDIERMGVNEKVFPYDYHVDCTNRVPKRARQPI